MNANDYFKAQRELEQANQPITFGPDIYETMLVNDECWFVTANGSAMLISDCSLMDC